MKTIGLWIIVFSLTIAPWILSTAWYAPGHNPVYPHQILRFEGEHDNNLWPWHHVPEVIREDLTENWFYIMSQEVLDPSGRIDGDQKIGNWGPWFNVLCIPALILTVSVCLVRREWSLVLLLAALVIPWLCMPLHGQTWSRFIMPMTLAGFVALGRVFAEFEKVFPADYAPRWKAIRHRCTEEEIKVQSIGF